MAYIFKTNLKRMLLNVLLSQSANGPQFKRRAGKPGLGNGRYPRPFEIACYSNKLRKVDGSGTAASAEKPPIFNPRCDSWQQLYMLVSLFNRSLQHS